MPYDIRWGLLDTDMPTTVAKAAQDGYTQGRTRAAYSALGKNPDDQNALNALMTVAPEKAIQYRQFRRQEGDYQREADYRSAAGDYLAAGGPQGTPMAFANGGGTANALMPQAPSPRDDAFGRMAKADPEKAMTVQSNQVKLSKEQLDLHQELNGAALRLLASVHDQPSYDAAKQRAASMYGRFGINIEDLQLPDAYDPETVKGLIQQTLKTDKLLADQRADRRLEWDIEDDQLDNSRADRNVDSMIDTRGQHVEISRANMNRTDARVRRGQDITSADRRRGQDITDNRVRGSYSYTHGGRRPSRSGVPQTAPAVSTAPRQPAPTAPAAGRIIVNPKTGERMQERNGQWVPVK